MHADNERFYARLAHKARFLPAGLGELSGGIVSCLSLGDFFPGYIEVRLTGCSTHGAEAYLQLIRPHLSRCHGVACCPTDRHSPVNRRPEVECIYNVCPSVSIMINVLTTRVECPAVLSSGVFGRQFTVFRVILIP